MNIKGIGAGLLILSFLSGCAVKGVSETLSETENRVRNSAISFEKEKSVGTGLWFSAKAVDHSPTGKEDSWLKGYTSLIQSDVIGFRGFISALQSYNESIIVHATPDARKALGSVDKSASGGSAGGSASGGSAGSGFELSYSGTYAGLFDTISSEAGVSWRSVGEYEVEFFKYEEKSFTLNSLQTKSKISSAQDGGSGFSATSEIATETWVDLKAAISAISSEGGTATLSPSLGLVMIRDIPSVVDRVETIIKSINALMSKQVIIDIEIIDYQSIKGNGAVADLSTAITQAGVSLGLSTMPTSLVGSGTASAAIVDGTSKWSGSTLAMSALNKMGKTSDIIHRSILAANNTQVPYVQKITNTYIASVGGGSVSGTGLATAPTVKMGTVDTSVNIFFYPRILSNNKVMMQVSIKIANVDSIRSVTTGSGATASTVEAPNTSSVMFEQTIFLRDGATLMLSGTSIKKASTSESAGILGGSFNDDSNTSEMVIMVTPHIVKG